MAVLVVDTMPMPMRIEADIMLGAQVATKAMVMVKAKEHTTGTFVYSARSQQFEVLLLPSNEPISKQCNCRRKTKNCKFQGPEKLLFHVQEFECPPKRKFLFLKF